MATYDSPVTRESDTMPVYEAPVITELGSVEGLTLSHYKHCTHCDGMGGSHYTSGS